MIRKRVFHEHNYKAVYFNGKTVRIAIDPSKPITKLEYPEFYDVKITDQCDGGCPYCYMDSKPEDPHAKDIIPKIHSFFGNMTKNQLPFQVAIGGGEPTSHPDFAACLKTFAQYNIVPNYTTNGMFIEKPVKEVGKIMDNTARLCGGVAVSCHPHLDLYWKEVADMFIEDQIRLNFHLIISDRESIDQFAEVYNKYVGKVEYFVLLPYGVQGRAEEKDIDWDYLLKVVPQTTNDIAFGANFHSYLTNDPGRFNVSLYEPESMSRFLDLKDMKVYPSSFMLDQEV